MPAVYLCISVYQLNENRTDAIGNYFNGLVLVNAFC